MRTLLFIFSLIWLLPANANNDILNSLITPKQDTFLPVNKAFKFDFDQQGNILFTGWDIEPGYYLYKKKLEIIAKGADIKVPEYGKGEEIEDEFFGITEVYFNSFSLVSKLSNISENAVVKIRYQGCAEAGLCYPPEVITIPLSPLPKAEGATDATSTAPSKKAPAVDTNNDNQQLSFSERLANQSLLTNLAIFFMVGVGLAFTPCVFPMFPILSSLIAGQQGLSTKKAFSLSFVYVQGMAVTYALLGLVVAALGGQVQGYIQHPAVLISFSLLFVLLAMAMFGWYEIKLPSGLMNKLTAISNQQKGGNYIGVFAMGVLSGLIASPCTTAPLSAALLYVAQSGDYFIGGITLYALSLGMGLPLLLLGTSGGKLLPKAGAWMEQVKILFGFIMLVVPLILLERILDFNIILWLASGLMLATALYLHHWQSQQSTSVFKTILWGIASLLLIASLLVSKQLIWPAKTINITQQQQGVKKFQLVEDLDALREAIDKANQNGQIAIVDLYADWCVACKEFEKYTFFEPEVQTQFQHFSLLKLDLTQNDKKSIEIMKEFNVFGLPTMLFFNKQGNELSDLRITGFMGPTPFSSHLKKVRDSVK
ncbi:protein-disulfide reductase DsbD [Pseudoalteromonas sp. JBTF-M23]|uniref:Thiol:disulfide interchange protein DsbD n=1 Tax=Pseudoalteromonas caenipelagi TaxID=2726988 RepID=A0A849VN66_9GAMM|nr:protein-disulfide reductase DsbD [Pseudoalteromonas caenipelagi]NOU53154.1 protein-disulfide reductase DsbD [Pseudoalteromonas caenipelagi]